MERIFRGTEGRCTSTLNRLAMKERKRRERKNLFNGRWGFLLINVDQSLCTLFLLLNFRPFVSTTKNLLISPLTPYQTLPIVVIFSFSRTLTISEKELSRSHSNMASSRWIRPEVFPLFASVGVAVGICAMQLVRNISSNPDVR
uniref:Uncharacterized protein n=1 Tax=Salix viminalis TaxID=40686 RepID=A0A6N2MNK1_SALVM